MFTSKELARLKDELNKTGMSLVRKKSLTRDELVEFGKSIAPSKKLLEWDFGKIMEMKLNINPENYLFSDEKVPLHWDGAFHKSPAYIIFYCTNISADRGGESLFVNTNKLYHSLNKDQKERIKKVRVKFTTEKKVHYGGEIEIPLLAKHRKSGEEILRIAEEVKSKKNPVMRTVVQGDDLICNELDELAKKSKFLIEHRWQKGDLLIVDNDIYLHGRNSLGENTGRIFLRVQAL